jgi:N-acetylneuraminic acid mutarotase
MLVAALVLLASWTPKAPMPHPIWFLFQDPVVVDGKMHVVAGGQIWQYDPAADAWNSRSAPLLTMRYHHALAAFNGKLYAFGGLREGEGGGPQTAVEEFDFAEGKWRARASLPGPRRDATAVVIGDRIYPVGGFDKTNQPLPILVYDPVRDAWEARRSVSKALSCWGAHWIDGRIYIFGSQEETPGSSVLEVYDPARDTISRRRPVPWPRVAYATAQAGGKIYVLGGHLTKLEEPQSSVDAYDPANDTWAKAADLPKPKSWAGALGVGTKIYVMGGVQTEWPRPERAVEVLELAAPHK